MCLQSDSLGLQSNFLLLAGTSDMSTSVGLLFLSIQWDEYVP